MLSAESKRRNSHLGQSGIHLRQDLPIAKLNTSASFNFSIVFYHRGKTEEQSNSTLVQLCEHEKQLQ